MEKIIYLSPSSQPENMYAVGNTSEQEQCRKIAAALKEELDRCKFCTYAGMTGTMYTRAAESNQIGVDLHMPIHTNAFDGKVAGLRIMVSQMGGEAEAIAKAIDKYLAPVTPGKSDGISAMPNLYEIRTTDAICVYLEIGFHDNREEAQWIIDNTQIIAEMIARGLCEYYGAPYISAEQPTPTFSDVDAGKWYANSIEYCAKHGIMQGDPDGKFRPNDHITRAEIAAVAERLHKMLK